MSNNRHSLFVEVLEAVWRHLKALMGTVYFNGDETKNKPGKLAAGSVATNMAFKLARSIEKELDLLLKMGGGALVANRYFVALCAAFGIPKERKQQPGDPYNLDAYDLADACMMNSLTILASYLSFGWYDEKMGGSSQTNRQKWKPDMSAILEVMPDVSFPATKTGRASVMDEIICEMSFLIIRRTKDVPYWLAWTLQIYLDILQSLGGECDRGYREMQQDIWDEDPTWVARKVMVNQAMWPNRTAPPFKSLRRNPIHCGLLLHNMHCSLHLSGRPYAAMPKALVGATQLYHALRQEKVLADGLMQGTPTLFINSDNRRNLKFMGYVSSQTNHRLEHPGASYPWSPAAVENTVMMAFIDSIQTAGNTLKQSIRKKWHKQGFLEHAGLLPPGLIRKLALSIQDEIPKILLNLFNMHGEAWDLLGRLKEGFTSISGLGPLSFKSDKLPLMTGLAFPLAAGQMSLQGDKRIEQSGMLVHIAADAVQKVVRLEEVNCLDCESNDPWGVKKLKPLLRRR
ncbi:hypothetical protein BBK36DRAFT_1173236 [Trichoderma citrinoviride]|uniref:Uncharacterized protein n=1 Tax=Trichoderma citrinoviride TaxID=58853 RepID=A0A2T4AXD4_9HYPO|nr:hypothetical protein BBK36DRAFT_1173236 [Trichoderma citrinoviride]PTB61709.1 hypothetical protein BBK36DRAFT_1173236 [Trichoderma citrinoviride]